MYFYVTVSCGVRCNDDNAHDLKEDGHTSTRVIKFQLFQNFLIIPKDSLG